MSQKSQSGVIVLLYLIFPPYKINLHPNNGVVMLKDFPNRYGALIFVICISSLLNGQDKKTLAVLDLEAIGISKTEARALTERLRSELVGTQRFTILERGKMDKIINEMGFQLSGYTSSECIVEAGQILGVQLMAGGVFDVLI